MAGVQLAELAAMYTNPAITKRFPKSLRDANNPTTINKKGIKWKNERYTDSIEQHSNETQARRRSNKTSDWEYAEQTRTDQTWVGKEKTQQYKKSMKILTKKFGRVYRSQCSLSSSIEAHTTASLERD